MSDKDVRAICGKQNQIRESKVCRMDHCFCSRGDPMTNRVATVIGKSDSFLPRQKQFFLAHWAEYLNTQTAAWH
jgi:hypothetical protein